MARELTTAELADYAALGTLREIANLSTLALISAQPDSYLAQGLRDRCLKTLAELDKKRAERDALEFSGSATPTGHNLPATRTGD